MSAGTRLAPGSLSIVAGDHMATKSKSALLVSPRSIWQLGRAIFAPERTLSKDESASTLFRFFRSKHVIDLRLIFTVTFVIFLLHVVIVVAFKHELESDLGLALAKFVAPAIPVYGAVWAWTYLTAASRLGVVDLFACEIGTLCRVGTIFDIGKLNIDRYKKGIAKQAADEKKSPSSAEGFVSKEDYFPIFAGNSRDLQTLEALVVAHITEFYTYMKAMRDSQRRMAPIEPSHSPIDDADIERPRLDPDSDPWRAALGNVIYLSFLGYESARNAISKLVEFEPTQAEDIVAILLTELMCYSFLLKYLKSDPVRFERLKLREKVYRREIPELYRNVMEFSHKYEEDWQPAKDTIKQLAERYEAAVNETIEQALDRIKRDEIESQKKLARKWRSLLWSES